AIIVFRLPASARLTIGDSATAQSGSERTFITPPLSSPMGKGFSYTVKATWTEGGKEKKVERVVRFKAGSRVVVDLTAAEKPREKTKPREKPKEREKTKEPDRPTETDTSERPERLKLPTPVKEPEKP